MGELEKLEVDILDWADNKGILYHSHPLAQLDKLDEEVEELKEAFENGDWSGFESELGDVLVVCTILAEMADTSLEACLSRAYKKISKRTGRMENGLFVKDD